MNETESFPNIFSFFKYLPIDLGLEFAFFLTDVGAASQSINAVVSQLSY